ncbi:MAG: PAS domain-containing protein, partial [Dehalococcoidia bacterium]|nr:PAS domain-containing protein [Dehalococcoidia bacterium]
MEPREQRPRRDDEERLLMGGWHWDFDSGRFTWSSSMYEIFDFAPEEFDGSLQMATERIHPDDQPAVAQLVRDMVAGGKPFPVEYRVVQR